MLGRFVRCDAIHRKHVSLAPGLPLAIAMALGSGTAHALAANAGADQALPDRDRQPGEVVTLRGTGSVPPISVPIPPGHMPDEGLCRIWIPRRSARTAT